MSIREPDQRQRTYDEVEFRASRAGTSVAIQMSRAAAEMRAEELAAEGWTCEIRDIRE
jgi:hypothetical protein